VFKTSVIIATHSRPNLLKRAVESAHSAGTDIEVIVVDDASTDETANVCGRLPNIRYIRVDRNQKVAGARNIGILNSTAEYITFLDDDDYRLPDSLDSQVAVLDAHPEIGFVYGRALVADQDGKVTGEYPSTPKCLEGDVFWELLVSNFICCHTAVFRKSCLSKVGILDTNIPGIDDWDLWIRISELNKVAFVDNPVSVWRRGTLGSNQGSSNVGRLVSMAVDTHQNKWMRLPRVVEASLGLRSNVQRQFRDSQASFLLTNAAATLAVGSSRKAIAELFDVFSLNRSYITRLYTLKVMGLGLMCKLGFSRGRIALENYI
jgi:glycosyltransferase involved in cell wall biosynthesis